MIDGQSYVTATDSQIADVVHQFTNPTTAPVSTKGQKVKKGDFTVHVYNGSGIDGLATTAASQLAVQGYNTVAEADAYEFPGKTTVIYAPKELQSYASALESMLSPANVQIVKRAPGAVDDGITVFVASSFDGRSTSPQEIVQQQQTLEKNQKVDWSTWKQYDAKTPIKLEAPTAWSSGFTYDQWRNYSIETTEGKHSAASVAVVETSQYGYWSIQAMRWTGSAGGPAPGLHADHQGPQVHALLPGRPPAPGGLAGARHALLGDQHAGQPALERPHPGPRGLV